VKLNPSIAESNTILIYAWNEHVEGGWICPTLANYGFTDRIDTLHNRFGKPELVKKVERNDASLLVWPNPTTGKLILNIHEEENWTLKNLTGIELLKGSGSECDLSALTSGIYFISSKNKTLLVMKI